MCTYSTSTSSVFADEWFDSSCLCYINRIILPLPLDKHHLSTNATLTAAMFLELAYCIVLYLNHTKITYLFLMPWKCNCYVQFKNNLCYVNYTMMMGFLLVYCGDLVTHAVHKYSFVIYTNTNSRGLLYTKESIQSHHYNGHVPFFTFTFRWSPISE